MGGAAVTEEIVPGFKFSRAAYLLSLLRPVIVNDLDLKVKRGIPANGDNSCSLSRNTVSSCT